MSAQFLTQKLQKTKGELLLLLLEQLAGAVFLKKWPKNLKI